MADFTIFGAGLAGPLIATRLGQAGHAVDLVEMRADPRAVGSVGGRSINLALSTRGTHALAQAGVLERVHEQTIPMKGRMMHSVEGQLTFQPYGTREDQVLYSVSRGGLNCLLLDAAEACPSVNLRFETKCEDLDLEARTATLIHPGTGEVETVSTGSVIGADGAFSRVRAAMARRQRFDYSQSYLEYGYKELSMPARPGGGYALETNALHIWPRRSFMMIALPNKDETFTVTLFLPYEGDHGFAAIESDADITRFFERQFPDALPLFPDLTEEYRANPVGSLVTVRCAPWWVDDRAVLIGDACHAVVPFYGQGMNAAFEDCTLLAEALDRNPGDRTRAFRNYSEGRKPDADALADLALANFVEMRDHTASATFLARRRLGHVLHRLFPSWFIPLYTMISFTRTPYAAARERARTQDRVVLWLGVALLIVLVLLLRALLFGAPETGSI